MSRTNLLAAEEQPGRQISLDFSRLALPSRLLESGYHNGAVDSASSEVHDPFESALPNPVPSPTSIYPSLSTQTPTPSQDVTSGLDLTGILDGALPNTNIPLSTPPVVKSAPNLRLPSFELLGIAAPHPDRITSLTTPNSFAVGAGPPSRPEDPLHTKSPGQRIKTEIRPELPNDLPPHQADRPSSNRRTLHHFVDTFTPPDDSGKINWSAIANVRTAAMESPAKSDDHDHSSSPIEEKQQLSASPEAPPSGPPANSAASAKPWLTKALETVLSTVDVTGGSSNPIQVLSHALPCPSITGCAFPTLISAIHEHVAASTLWINVCHAVPGKFNLADLPQSPPSTPGPAIGGEDYFTKKVYDNAVAVNDYQADTKLLGPNPHPIVPPSTVTVSIVERYIPPTSPNEFSGLFSLSGRSLLTDRLVELSPNNGSLIFIYPTKRGARTFMDQYLSPVLAPLLRSTTVINDLSADLGASLGHMSSVDKLLEFADARSRLERYCERLSKDAMPLLQHATFSVVHASKEEVMLERPVWSRDWWIKQEKPRVREAVHKFFRIAKRLPADAEVVPTEVIQKILDGVERHPYPVSKPGPTNGVEVGVFVIRKSAPKG